MVVQFGRYECHVRNRRIKGEGEYVDVDIFDGPKVSGKLAIVEWRLPNVFKYDHADAAQTVLMQQGLWDGRNDV